METEIPQNADSEQRLQDWLANIEQQRSKDEWELIKRACDFAVQAHAGQKRASGEPYIHHALAVAEILDYLRLDAATIAAAILHDVVEDTEADMDQVRSVFGEDVATMVDGVTKVDLIQGLQSSDEQVRHRDLESLRKMLLAMAEDVRIVLIKLADRLHNMRTLASLTAEQQQRISRETMEIFAPLANRLGIWQIKWQLEDLSFRYLHPQDYQQLAGKLAEKRVDREQFIESIIATLSRELKKADISAEVSGRPKHIYGIWRKMQKTNRAFEQIFDVRAVRILVQDISSCYAALGVVHALWQYIPGEFDDYIATPKANDYQSLHTAVVGPGGQTIEIQIRTHEMHKQAEMGVASHWRYKEGRQQDEAFDQKINWLRQLLEWKDELAEASDFVDQFKSEIFSDRVYVFTPQGKIIDLPNGATPLDFAYHIHTEVGHRCRGAKVNGRIVPLSYELQTGEQVEILTVKQGEPSLDWLNTHLGYIKTPRARSCIRHWFRQQDFGQNVSLGREILERELQRVGLNDVSHEKLAQKLDYRNADECYAALGRGELKPMHMINMAYQLSNRDQQQPLLSPASSRTRTSIRSDTVDIHGVGNLLTQIARCCKPVPGDAIIGYITVGKGVTVHRQDCPNILNHKERGDERLIEVHWGHATEQTYPVDIQIIAYDRQGLLHDITAVFANAQINVLAAQTNTDKREHVASMILTVEISDIDTLSQVLGKIEMLPNIIRAKRAVS